MTVAGAARTKGWLAAVCALGIALHLPSFATGFYVDDYVHQLVLGDVFSTYPMGPLSLYDFGELADWKKPELTGSFPWWTAEDWKVRFFRPLTSLTLQADHALWGGWAPGYHATSLLLWGALLLLVHALYRALGLAPGTALLALALFAVTDSAVLPVGWIANRNSLLSVLFTIAAVLVVAKPRASARPSRVACALLLAWLATLSKESGVSAFALLAVRALLDRAEGHRRGTGVLFALATSSALLHVGFLLVSGYGSESIFYPTPWTNPGTWAVRAAATFFVGGVSLVAPIPVDLLQFYPRALLPAALVGALILLPFARALLRRVREHRAVVLLVSWIPVALLPQTMAPPSERLLLGAAVASSALLALFVVRLRAEGRPTQRRVAYLVLALAGPGSALLALMTGGSMIQMSTEIRETVLAADVGPVELGHREVFVLQSQNGLVPFSMAATWAVETDDHDLEVSVLQMGRRGLLWRRTGERSFELETTDEPFLNLIFESVYLTEAEPPGVGARFETRLFTAEIVAADERGPRTVRFELTRDLDAPVNRFLAWDGRRLAAIEPPRVGGVVELARIAPPRPFVP